MAMGRTTSKGARFWARHVEQYRLGGLTLREYCQRHGLKPSTFGRWRRRLCRDDTPITTPPAPVNIVRVDLPTAPVANTGTLELVLGNGRCIRVAGDFDGATLTRLIATLEQVA